MKLVADAVAWFGKEHAVSSCHALDEFVVISVLESCLKCVVIYVCYRKFCFNTFYLHSFKLKVYHCSCRVLCKSLIHSDGYFFTRFEGSFNQMVFQNLICKCFSHLFRLLKNIVFLYTIIQFYFSTVNHRIPHRAILHRKHKTAIASYRYVCYNIAYFLILFCYEVYE